MLIQLTAALCIHYRRCIYQCVYNLWEVFLTTWCGTNILKLLKNWNLPPGPAHYYFVVTHLNSLLCNSSSFFEAARSNFLEKPSGERFNVENMKLFLLSYLLTQTRADVCPSGCNCFKDQSQKTFVDCSSRDLPSIPLEFPSDVFTIDLSNNNIDILSELPALDYLLTLNLTQNRISTIDVDAFDDMESLTTVDLRLDWVRK